MDSTEALRARSRTAYERGRLQVALIHAAPVPALALLSLIGSHEPILTVLIAAIAFTTLVILVYRGGAVGAGTKAGFLLGLIPFTSAIASRGLGHVEAFGSCFHGCMLVCAGASFVATLVLLRLANRQTAATSYALAGGWTILTIGATACACVGVAGVALLVASVTVVALPVAALSRSLVRAS